MSSLSIYGTKDIFLGEDNKYHYVYRITNIVENKHYYGKRSSSVDPYEDLGRIYLSSSTDKNFILEQKQTPEKFKYKIIKCFYSSTAALLGEIYLHNKFNVNLNHKFYNKAKVTSSKFDVTGYKHSDEYKQWQSIKSKILWEDEEYREKQAQSNKNRWEDIFYRQKFIEKMKSITSTEAYKEKQSNITKEKWKDDNFRKTLIESMKLAGKDENNKIKKSLENKKRWQTKEYREKQHNSRKKSWESEERRKKVSELFKNTKWFNNGKINKRLNPDNVPEGFVPGKLSKNNK